MQHWISKMKIVKFSEMLCLVNFEKKDWSQKFIRIIQNSRTAHQGKRVHSQANNNTTRTNGWQCDSASNKGYKLTTDVAPFVQ